VGVRDVVVPATVIDELGDPRPGNLPGWDQSLPPPGVDADVPIPPDVWRYALDPGESMVLALALSYRAAGEDVEVVLDERIDIHTIPTCEDDRQCVMTLLSRTTGVLEDQWDVSSAVVTGERLGDFYINVNSFGFDHVRLPVWLCRVWSMIVGFAPFQAQCEQQSCILRYVSMLFDF